MTTSGFLPPSSRQGDWRCRPHSSPIRRPTSVEPVNPTLSTSPRSSASASPQEEVAGVDDLLDLAAGLTDGLADLPGDGSGQGFPVLFHQSPDLLDGPPPDRSRNGRPVDLSLSGDAARIDERLRPGELG